MGVLLESIRRKILLFQRLVFIKTHKTLAPVTLNPKSEKIAMTSPVSQQSSGEQWRIAFVMPASYTMETLPTPEDSRVQLQEVPERLVATLRYSGSPNDTRYQKRERMLRDWIRDKG